MRFDDNVVQGASTGVSGYDSGSLLVHRNHFSACLCGIYLSGLCLGVLGEQYGEKGNNVFSGDCGMYIYNAAKHDIFAEWNSAHLRLL